MGTNKAFLAELSRVTQSIASNFALGGKVEISPSSGSIWADSADTAASVTQQAKAKSVILRWDGPSGVHKIDFGVSALEAAQHLEALVHDCQPATFGYQGRDVYVRG